MTTYAVRLLTILGYLFSIMVFAVTIPIFALGLLLVALILEFLDVLGTVVRSRNPPSHVLDLIEQSEKTKVVVTEDDTSIIRKKVP